jgi:hypothetical protein
LDLLELLIVAGHAVLLGEGGEFGDALPGLLQTSLEEVISVVGGIDAA